MTSRYRIGFDIGGTFTDFILLDERRAAEHQAREDTSIARLCSCRCQAGIGSFHNHVLHFSAGHNSAVAIGPSRAPVACKYSTGASRICSPRMPAETDTTSNSSIVSSTYTG